MPEEERNNHNVHRLHVLPNTGHHYFFVPFSKSSLTEAGGLQSTWAKNCRSNTSPWEPCCLNGEETPATWIRARFGYKGKKSNIGIWIAIETNVGPVTRGTFLNNESVTEESLPEPENWSKTPYALKAVTDIRPLDDKTIKQYEFTVSIKATGKQVTLATIQVVWGLPEPATMDVDLVVDFGNTRSVVLGLENNAVMGREGDLCAICKAIRYLPRGFEYPDLLSHQQDEVLGETIADSWFLLQDPQFSEWDYPPLNNSQSSPFNSSISRQYYSEKRDELAEPISVSQRIQMLREGKILDGIKLGQDTVEVIDYSCMQRVPQMFVEVSPAMMGPEAKEFYHNIDLSPGLNICMSSPKRYLWDRRQYGLVGGELPWNINYNPWRSNAPVNSTVKLCGQICRYMTTNADFWKIDEPPFEAGNNLSLWYPSTPSYPRCAAMVWCALSIIENAFRQITSENWRKGAGQFQNRRLRSVNITFPSGWIAQEKQYLREAWEQAINIFTLAHMQNKETFDRLPDNAIDGRPKLNMELDEAVASQIPFIYSEVRRLQDANMWIKLYGRCDGQNSADHNAYRLRVMTVDIGGGTCDSAIVEYRNSMPGATIDLRYKVLFRDCSTFAGDAVMQKLIENVLLPSILSLRISDKQSQAAHTFADVLVRGHKSYTDRATWRRITSMVFLPIARQWLTDVKVCTDGIFREESGERFRRVQNCGVDETALKDFNKYMSNAGLGFEVITMDDRLEYDPAVINNIICDTLDNGIEPLGKFISAYDVDLVTLSGKISEMPVVHELLCSRLPLRPQRIISMSNFQAGGWYPMNENSLGKISDAKTVTAVGAALFVAAQNNLMAAAWNIAPDTKSNTVTRNYWGLVKSHGRGFDGVDGEPILRPNEESNEKKTFTMDGKTFHGTPMRIGQFIGRQKYYSRQSVPEQQYELCWLGRPEQAPRGAVAVVINRTQHEDEFGLTDDDIELEECRFIDEEDEMRSEPSLVGLRLNTLPQKGFWMEEARFNMDLDA